MAKIITIYSSKKGRITIMKQTYIALSNNAKILQFGMGVFNAALERQETRFSSWSPED